MNPRKLNRPSRIKPKYSLPQTVSEYALAYGLWEEGERILVAVSGGPDSVALLHILREVNRSFNLKLTVVHLDHGLRGETSREDAQWVKSLAKRLNIPCIAGKRDLDIDTRTGSRSLEEVARIARYEFFSEISKKTGVRTLALGHHADDQAETVLLKLLRGCSPTGLGGMRLSRMEGNLRIIRPLLAFRRSEILEYLNMIGETFRQDLSNQDCRFLRNRIRHELIPLIENHYNPKIREILVHLSRLVQEQNEYLKDRIEKIFPRVTTQSKDGILIDCRRLQRLSRYEQGEVLRKIFWRTGVKNLHRDYFRDLQQLMAGPSGRRLILPGGITALHQYNTLKITTGEVRFRPRIFPPRKISIPGEEIIDELQTKVVIRHYHCPQLKKLSKPVDLAGYWKSYPENGGIKEYLDQESVFPPLIIRTRLPGDRYRPLSMTGSRKLKEIFIDAKVPLSLRESIPLIEDSHGIIWLAGYRPAHRCRVKKSTKKIMEINLIPY